MKTLTPKPKTSLITRVKRPLIASTAIISSMSACVAVGETFVREMPLAGEMPEAGETFIGEAPLAGETFIGEAPLAGEMPEAGETFIGEAPQAGDQQMIIEPGDMSAPIDDPSAQDQSIAGSEPLDMMAADLSVRDLGMIDRVDMANDELDAELNVGLPPERDFGIDEPDREEP